ncbi:uncharacterized protein LOC120085783 [Benincasa hispida]|uniref:uncharacterized protein LOC120085783 n=1 Tax=Benincasa hispida TaxID=102211 RepID=UPI001901B814|nr:uncharacterized protein LOC120085783 [Benincasa hispida]
MSSNRERDDPLSFIPTNPSSSSSPVSVSDPRDSFLSDPTTHIGSASGSFQNEGLLSDFTPNISDAEFGFSRPEFRQTPLIGTVDFYDRHVFLCYKNPQVWPPRIEAAEFDRLPRLLSAAVMSRKGDMKKETRLTICEGHDGTETSNGDVLIFPDMIRYRRLTHFDVDTFVEEVLVKNGEWQPGSPEALKGSYVFVCCHGSRDRRCGVCGPTLVSRFRDEIKFLGLQNEISVSPCSHIGGHKYAGNVIIYGSNANGEVTGHWYGYVSPEDVFLLLQHHILKGKIVDELWRGQMGLSEEEQKLSLERRLSVISGTNGHKSKEELAQIQTSDPNPDHYRSHVEVAGCCQGDGDGYSSCCQNPELSGTLIDSDTNNSPPNVVTAKSNRKLTSRSNSNKSSSRKVCAMPTCLESWEREDTYAVAAVICAAVSVAFAYRCYKQL